MTNKELLYIEDAISHEGFLAKSSSNASKQLLDVPFSNYMKELEDTHNKLSSNFFNLL